MTPEQILEVFAKAGMNLEPSPNALYTVRGQHAQLINGARALLAAPLANPSDKQEAATIENIASIMGRNCNAPSQNPVAYLSTEPRKWDQCRIKPQGSFTVPVFTHAERNEPLTDEEIEEISHQRETWSVIEFARAIIAAAPLAQSAEQDRIDAEPFGWVQPKGGNYFTRSETAAKRIGGLVPVYLKGASK